MRRLHNLAINLGWLAWPILAKQAWPRMITARRRAIKREEHTRIINAEQNTERRNFYEFLWETGCSQSDAANPRTDAIDWNKRVLSYHRMKLGATQRLQRAIGKRRAKELLFTGRTMGVDEAYALGLVARVVDDVAAVADEVAAGIAKAPGLAMALTKQAVDLGEEVALSTGVRIELAAIERVLAEGGWRQGVEAFGREVGRGGA